MAAKKKGAKKKAVRKRSTAKRELIDTGTNKLFVRRNARGTSFKGRGRRQQVGRDRSANQGEEVAKGGMADRGDRKH